jgi:hypothetical protein
MKEQNTSRFNVENGAVFYAMSVRILLETRDHRTSLCSSLSGLKPTQQQQQQTFLTHEYFIKV